MTSAGLAARTLGFSCLLSARPIHQVLKTVLQGLGCEAIFLEPDGQHVLIWVTNENNVAEFALQTISVVRRITTGQGPDERAWIGK